MKKSLTGMLTLLAGAFAVHAQGTVSLSAYGTGLNNYIYIAYKPMMGAATDLGGAATGPAATLANYGSAGIVANGNDWSIQLYSGVGSGASPLTASGTPAMFANGATDGTPGTWFSTEVVNIPGTTYAGTLITVQLYAWYNEGGAITSYATALNDSVPTGTSGIDTMMTGGPQNGGGPPETAPGLPLGGLGNFNLSVVSVPEPSTIALGVFGASAFLMRIRRKN
jgi:hypothetical protein